MGWSAGNPGLPAATGRPTEGTGRGDRREVDRPSAWVPPSTRIDREEIRSSRIDALRFLLSGTVYLVLVVVSVAVASLQQLIDGSTPLPPDLGTIRNTIGLFGWLGLWGCGLLLHFFPAQIGIPYRPVRLARIHLVLANIGVLGFAAASLGWGLGSAAEAFLLLTAVSYLVFALPLLLLLILSIQDWMADGL
ncbi:MAG: hypothetical protein ACYDFT_01395 [Thermoplasmata archaeon]